MSLNYLELLHALLPEASLVVGVLLILGVDLTIGRGRPAEQRVSTAAWLGLIAVGAAMYHSVDAGVPGAVFGGAFVLDPLAMGTRLGVLGLAGLTLLLLPNVLRLAHAAEYVVILLLATCGFTLMAISQQLLVAFLALELASLSLYILAGFDKTRSESAEAGLKYFLFGGVSAAFLLFGFSLLYGLSGSIVLPEIAAQISLQPLSPLLVVALVMILVAFGFKAAAAPFHLWAPDAYQGAPASSSALIASASKLAGFALFTRLLWHGAGPAAGDIGGGATLPGWLPILAALIGLSLLIGNLAALAQTNLRRLVAYSAIAHAGALLLGVVAASDVRFGPSPVFYYAATYGLATVGIFGVIAVVERADGRCQNIVDLAGLYRRSPLLAGCLLVFVLSLAGIPPLAGFFGKFLVFAAVLKLGGLSGLAGWLALLAIGMSAVGLYYYLVILKQALVVAPLPSAQKIKVPGNATLALLLAAALLLGLGLYPSVLLRLVS